MSKLDFSKITQNLYVGRSPKQNDYSVLEKQGITLVLNMRAERLPVFRRSTLIPELWVPLVDTPLTPYSLQRLEQGAKAAQAAITNGGKVYVYCHRGRHRSVTMAIAILLLQGMSLEKASLLVTTKRPIADLRALQVRHALAKFARSVQLLQ